MYQGNSTADAINKLRQYGYNELPSSKPKTIRHIALEVMKEPMFILLIICALLYVIIGDYREGIVLLSTVLLIIGITFYQHRKAERALDALKKLASPYVLVMRDGVEIKIPGREIVPDDILVLNEGDRISADSLILNSTNLTVDESLLTGESVPVSKTLEGIGAKLYSGTLIVQGRAIAKVVSTGINSKIGEIATSLKTIKEDETRLYAEIKILIRRLAVIGIIISISIIVVFYFTRGNFVQSLLNGLASAMAILPEEFPVVFTVFLALGAWRLSKNNVLTRKPSAIETLGSITVLCTDKTGTITQNQMEISAVYEGDEIINKGHFLNRTKDIEDSILTAKLASSDNSIDPMENAIGKIADTIHNKTTAGLKLVKEYPLSQELFAMTRVLQNENTNELIVAAKGAPEAIFNLCNLTRDEKAVHHRAFETMANAGLRVLGVAKGTYVGTSLPDNQYGFSLNFCGLIGFEDPIRDEVPPAIQSCYNAGIKTIMITGDNPVTAKNIALHAGIKTTGVITGDELEKMSAEELQQQIKDTAVFARVVPQHKLRIIHALKANGEIIAMTGDGVNDAPALKAADVGIAMGKRGTDVAREASSLILLDDNFASIVSAIRQGRAIYDNMQKAMSYILSVHMPIIGLTLIPAFFSGLPILLFPLHIVFMELLIDPASSIAFESQTEEKGIMNRPPRKPEKKFFGIKHILFSLFQGILLLAMVLVVYFVSIKEAHTEKEIRAIAFSSLIMGNIALVLTNLSKRQTLLSIFTGKNLAAIIILSLATLLLIAITLMPSLNSLFNLQFPGYRHLIPFVIGIATLIFVLEFLKYLRYGKSLIK